MRLNRKFIVKLGCALWLSGLGAFMLAEEATQPSSAPTSEPSSAKPVVEASKHESEALKSGDLSLRFLNADVRTVVQVLAEGADLNLIMGDDLKGNVTVQLRDVSYEDALRLVLESKGFAAVREKNIVKIRSLLVTAATPEPLETAVLSLRYAQPEELAKSMTPLLSALGKVTVDKRTNAIVIAEVAARLPRLKAVVESLDTRPLQVMIQSKLWEIVKNPTEVKGIDWSATAAAYNLGLTAGGAPLPKPDDLQTGKTTVDSRTLATTFLLSNIHFMSTAVMNAQQLRATVGYLYTDNDAEIIGTPHVAVEDGKEAKLNVSTQVPIPTFQFNAQTATLQLSGFTYKDIGITLKVTPRISRDQFVNLQVSPEVSNLNTQATFSKFGVVTGSGTNIVVPVIDTRTSTTEVVIKSGNTLAIGGLMRDDINKAYTKIPVLGDVPILGNAFRSRNLNRTKRNLLIFITPTILDPEGGTGLESEAKDFPSGKKEVYADDTKKTNAKPKESNKKANQFYNRR